MSIARVKLPADKSEEILFDDALAGFGLRLRVGGKRTWIAQYRLGKKQRRITLGTPETLNADEARKAARSVMAKVHLGVDPQAAKIEAKVKAAGTLGTVVDRFLEHANARLRPRSYVEVERHLSKHWAPLKGLAVHGITRGNIAARLAEIAKESGPVAANRARASLSSFYTWAMREGLADVNPVVGTNKAAEEQSRDRVLSDTELLEVWNACRDDDYGRIVRLLILSGQRREEVGGMEDAEIDVEKRLWSIPRERTKNRLPHDVPLSEPALAILKEAPRRKSSGHLFGDADGRPFSGWSGARDALDERMAKSRPKPSGKQRRQDAPRWHLHDIRRTVATRMAELGVLPHVIEAVLNHVSGHRAGVAGIYNRATYAAEKRQALDRWAAHVEALVAGTPDNIVPLRAD
jgi:integrase